MSNRARHLRWKKAHRDGKRREAEVQPLPEVRDPKEERDTWKDEWIKRSGVFGDNGKKFRGDNVEATIRKKEKLRRKFDG